nr:hypothetical protein [Sphingopyxis solisilvae]
MQIAKGPAKPVRIARYQDDMDMVGHQAIGPDLGLRPPRRLGEEIKIDLVVAVLEEGPLAPVAALGNMVRNAREDEARKAGHAETLCKFGG